MTEAGTYYLVLPNSTSVSVTFSWDNSTTDEFALMGKPKIVSGYSKQVVTACQNHSINTSGFDTAVTTDFQEYDITYEVPETDDIEQDDPLSALSFFDSNNQFSPFTIPQIDTTNINVNVSAQSKQ